MNLENEIKKKLDDILFIELKKNTKISGELIIKKGLPLPIKKKYLEKTIKENIDVDEIKLEKLLDSMLYLIGIESEFKYNEEYIFLIKKLLKKPKEYLMHKSFSFENKSPINAIIYIRSYNYIYDYDIDIKFKQINILEDIYNKNISDFNNIEREEFLKKIINNYEEIIKRQVDYYLAYFRLGYIYLSMGKYIKSRLYFEKFLQYSEDENLNQEVRDELKELEDYANIDAAKTYISYGKFYKALESLEKISSLYPNREELNFLLGQTYYNMEEYEKSKEFLEESIRENTTEENINLLALNYMNLENQKEAIEIYKLGLEKLENSYILNYNLGVTYLNLKEYKNAMYYLDRANKINFSEEIEKIKNNLKKGLT